MNLFDMFLQIDFIGKLFITDVAGMPLSFVDIFLVYMQTLSRNEIFLTYIALMVAGHYKNPSFELRTNSMRNI